MRIFKLGLRFDKNEGLEYISISFFHNIENRKNIISVFPMLAYDADTIVSFYSNYGVDAKYFSSGHYEYMTDYEQSNLTEYIDAYHNKIDIFVNIFELSIDDREEWKKEKNKLNTSRLDLIRGNQIDNQNLVSKPEQFLDKNMVTSEYLTCADHPVNIMMKPRFDSKVIGILAKGDIVKSTARKTSAKYSVKTHDYTYIDAWYELEFKGNKCWAYGGGLKKYNLPIALNDNLIVPKKRVGKITKATSYDMLISYYGARNTQEVTEEFGGYEEENPPTVLFQGTSKEIEIFWKDQYRKQIDHLEIFGQDWNTLGK